MINAKSAYSAGVKTFIQLRAKPEIEPMDYLTYAFAKHDYENKVILEISPFPIPISTDNISSYIRLIS